MTDLRGAFALILFVFFGSFETQCAMAEGGLAFAVTAVRGCSIECEVSGEIEVSSNGKERFTLHNLLAKDFQGDPSSMHTDLCQELYAQANPHKKCREATCTGSQCNAVWLPAGEFPCNFQLILAYSTGGACQGTPGDNVVKVRPGAEMLSEQGNAPTITQSMTESAEK